MNMNINIDEPLEMYNFMEKTRYMHLTLGDLKGLCAGETIDVLSWDGNWEEYWIWENAKNEHPYDPHVFFKQNRCKITNHGNGKWDITFSWGQTVEHPVHLDISELDFISERHKKGYFYHLDNNSCLNNNKHKKEFGYVHVDKQNFKKHWLEFPDEYRVGFRGPMMLWSDLDKCPKVYLRKGYYGEDL